MNETNDCWKTQLLAWLRRQTEDVDCDSCLRLTDESEHHLRTLARRIKVAGLVYATWTSKGADPAAVANTFVDGRMKSIENFVTEVASEEANETSHEEEEGEDESLENLSEELEVRDAENLSYEEFWLKYMLANKPVIIRGVTRTWKASREWVKPEGGIDDDLLVEYFGQALVWVTHCKESAGKVPGEREQWTFREYMKYWKKYSSGKLRTCGPNEDSSSSSPLPLLYLKDWHFPTEFAEYGAYVTPTYFSDDWLNEYYDYLQREKNVSSGCCNAKGNHKDQQDQQETQQSLEQSDYRFLYLGLEGTKTGLHADVLRSFSWSVNISGKKRWYLLSPKFTHLLYDTFGRNLASSFFDVDEQVFPNIKHARKHLVEVIQDVGEAIFVPSGWHHTVENLEDTLSINHNWFNACNINYSWELLQRERHEAEQAICDCRSMCANEDEFEELVQKNVTANASMNYENFASLLMMIAEERVKCICRKQSESKEPGIECLMWAYEAKMAYAILPRLIEKIPDGAFKAKIRSAMEDIRIALPHVNFQFKPK